MNRLILPPQPIDEVGCGFLSDGTDRYFCEEGEVVKGRTYCQTTDIPLRGEKEGVPVGSSPLSLSFLMCPSSRILLQSLHKGSKALIALSAGQDK